MLLLLLEMLAVGLAILGLYRLKDSLGLGPLFAFVAGNQFLQHLLAVSVYVEILGRFPVSPGSAVLFTASLFAILVLYVNEDVPAARRLIYGLVIANTAAALFFAVTGWGLARGIISSHLPLSDWLANFDPGSSVAGAVILCVDVLILLVGYEFLRSRVRWVPRWARIVAALWVALTFDAAIFVTVALDSQEGASDLFIGNLAGKLTAGLIYGTMLWASIRFSSREHPEESREPRDPLSIFTYRERYKRLEERQAELELAHEEEMRGAKIALEGAHIGLWGWDLDSGATRHDRRLMRMLGYSEETSLAQIDDWVALIHPEDATRTRRMLVTHLKGEATRYRTDLRLKGGGGDWIWLMVIGQVLERDRTGRALSMGGAYLDIDERKRAELALVESERRYEHATAAARVGVWEWDLRSNEVYVDPRLKSLLGYEDHEVGNRLEDWERHLHPNDAARVKGAVKGHLDGEKDHYQVERRMVHKDGSIRWFLSQGSAVWGADGEPLLLVGTDADITDRKRAEQKLEQLEYHYRDLFEKAPLMYVTTVDVSGQPYVKDCNSTFLEALGYRREDVIGHPLADFYSEESRRDLLEGPGYGLALAGEVSRFANERRLVTRDGKTIVTMLRGLSEEGQGGRVVGMRLMFVDITDRKFAEEALKRSEQRLVEAQRVARVGSWERSWDEEVFDWSVEHYAILGVDPASFSPTFETFLACVHADDRAEVQRRERGFSGPGAQSLDFRIVRPDGEVRHVQGTSHIETDAEGNPVRTYGTMQDVTVQKLAENEIRTSREQLRRLAANLERARETEREEIAREIHDELGQSLTGLKMDLSALRPSLAGDAVARCESMSSLIDRTIDSVRDLSSRLRPSVLDDLGLREAIEWQAGEFGQRYGADCVLDLGHGEDIVDAQISLSVFRIFQEALTNIARHANAATVRITLHQDAGGLKLLVEDDGIGIDAVTAASGDSLGLLGMRERAASIGGFVSVRPAGAGGTNVEVRVPL